MVYEMKPVGADLWLNNVGPEIRPPFSFLIFFSVKMFRALDQLIKYHGNHAQDDDGSDDHIELEEMEGVGETDRHGVAWLCVIGSKYPLIYLPIFEFALSALY